MGTATATLGTAGKESLNPLPTQVAQRSDDRHHGMREVINEGHLGMKRLGLLGAVIAVVAGLVAFGIWRHHVTGPRLEVQVQPRAVMGKSECRAVARNAGYGPHGFPAPRLCYFAGSAASYFATVTNTGGRGATVLDCRIDAIGRSGHVIRESRVPDGIVGGLPGIALDPGASRTFDWFVRVAPERVARYTGSCSHTENAGAFV